MVPSGTTASPELTPALIAAAAALLVAFVAGAFSLLGLIISKEQQVSAFRQSWIDALREDIATLVARAHQIQGYGAHPVPFNYSEFWKETHLDYVELNQASIRIKLRMNPTQPESKPVLEAMGKMEALFDRLGDPSSTDELRQIVNILEKKAPALLKKEWNRVKKGERTYRIAKWFATLFFCTVGFAVMCLLWGIHR
jgi:hypothetical protein